VYGINRVSSATDAYLGIPTAALGTEYINLTYKTTSGYGTALSIVASQDNTTVTITPTVTTDGHTAGTGYTVALNQGQTYYLANGTVNADLSGSIVTSDKPVALFGSVGCVNIPAGIGYCDHIVEEIPPTSTWGKGFVTVPLGGRQNGDTFRFLASTAGTSVWLNGSMVASLDRGQFYEQIISGTAVITATAPILVAQYANGINYDHQTGDPFMMLIPPYEQLMADYTIATPPTGFTLNYINIVAPNAALGLVTVDGTAIPAGSYTSIGNGFSGVAYTVTVGTHHLQGPLPFGASVYGWTSADSYGYPSGQAYSPVASVSSVSLTQHNLTTQVGQQVCVTALVVDQSTNPLQDIRVDFAVSGSNSASGFDSTDVNGHATFCYTPSNGGSDTIVASVGSLNDTANVTVTSNYTLTVNKAGTGQGAVIAAYGSGTVLLPGTATLPAQITNIAAGTVITLTAVPSNTSVFAGWSGAVSSAANPVTVTMDADKVVTATFDLSADLAVTENVLRTANAITYTIVARNIGPGAADGAVVSSTFPAEVISITWTCVAAGGGAACGGSGTGNVLADTLTTFPSGGVVTYTVQGTLGMLDLGNNVVTVTPPSGVVDPNLLNNRAEYKTYRLLLPLVFRNYQP